MTNQVKRTERDDKIKLEDMTLVQIKELKKTIKRAIGDAIRKTTEPYDVGQVGLSIDTEIDELPYYFESCGGHITAQSEDCEKFYTYHIKIKFSKEDD